MTVKDQLQILDKKLNKIKLIMICMDRMQKYLL